MEQIAPTAVTAAAEAPQAEISSAERLGAVESAKAPVATNGDALSDRINELYRGEIFGEETARIARDRVHWMCQQCAGDRVLDVGCSQGITAILLAREGICVTAIDSDPASIEFAAAEIAREGPQVRSRLTLLETDLASLPVGSGFDTVILGEVLEHQALPERFVRNAAGRLAPGGALVITTPFALHPHPDHKISVMPRHVAEIAAHLDLQIVHLDVVDGYIRCVMRAGGDQAEPRAKEVDLLRITETATLASQRRLFDRLDERADQLRRRSEALKVAQKKGAQIAAEAEAAATERAQFIDRLKAQHKRALAEFGVDLNAALARAIQAERTSDSAVAALAQGSEARKEDFATIVALRNQLEESRQALEIERRNLQEAAEKESQLALELDRARVEVLKATSRLGELAAMDASRHESSTLELREVRLAHQRERTELRRRIVALRESKEHVRRSSSFRLGRALVRSLESLRGALALPRELTAIASDAFARRRARGRGDAREDSDIDADVPVIARPATQTPPVRVDRPVKPSPAPRALLKRVERVAKPAAPAMPETNFAPFIAAYKSGGLAAVRLALSSASASGCDVVAPRALLGIGKAMAAEGKLEAEFELASAAIALDASTPILRGYFWAAQRSARFDAACDAIRRIEQAYGSSPGAVEQKVLDRLHASPSYMLTVLDLIPEEPTERLAPIAGRICYMLHNSLPYSSGGYGTRSHGVALGLVASGYEVIALTRPGFPTDAKPELNPQAVPLEDTVDGLRYLRTLRPTRRGTAPPDYLAQAADAFEMHFRRLRPALVLAASNYVTALPALIAARRLGLPFVYEVRGLWEITRISREPEYEQTPGFAVQRLLESRVMQLADHVFTLTEPMLEELLDRGVLRERIDLLPNSCNPERFVARPRDEDLARRLALPPGVPVIGYIGTFVDYEGLDDLAMGCALLKRRGVTFRLLLVGNENTSGLDRGPITKQIETVAANEGFSDWLVMPGRVPHDEVEAYYSLIDIAPFPRKPLPVCEMVSPMKPLEALAMEKAVVVSSVRALTEMIGDGKTGRVFEKGNLASLADVLQELIAQPSLRAELGRRGSEWVSAERTWNQVGQKFRKVMAAVLPGRAEPTGEIMGGPASPVVVAPPVVETSGAIETLPPSPRADPARLNGQRPPWWDKIDISLRGRCGYVDVARWELSDSVLALRDQYIARFDADAVARRIPHANWARADICAQKVAQGDSLLDVGSGLGEFINLVARRARHGKLTSVDVRDWDLWFDATGQLQRIKRDFFELDGSCACDVVTCFEVIEHLPTERVAEAVRLLRSLARQRLYVSVPFMEGLPMHRGHRTRFDATNLSELFPDARFTVYGKGGGAEVRAWIMCEIDMTSARSATPH